MALSRCMKCGNGFFEVVEKEPSGSNFIVMFVQCSSCGNPIGVMDYFNIGSIVNKLEQRLEILETQCANIDHNIRIIAQMLRSK